jgi:hypothetical protein
MGRDVLERATVERLGLLAAGRAVAACGKYKDR